MRVDRIVPPATGVLIDRRLRGNVHKYWKGFGSYSTVGLELALSVIVGLFAGQWLDEKLDSGGLLTVLGMVLGAVAGFRSLFRALRRANREAEKTDTEERAARRDYHDDHRP